MSSIVCLNRIYLASLLWAYTNWRREPEMWNMMTASHGIVIVSLDKFKIQILITDYLFIMYIVDNVNTLRIEHVSPHAYLCGNILWYHINTVVQGANSLWSLWVFSISKKKVLLKFVHHCIVWYIYLYFTLLRLFQEEKKAYNIYSRMRLFRFVLFLRRVALIFLIIIFKNLLWHSYIYIYLSITFLQSNILTNCHLVRKKSEKCSIEKYAKLRCFLRQQEHKSTQNIYTSARIEYFDRRN